LEQPNGGWSSFHDQHINEIARGLNRLLPADYYATTEDSMQIKTRSEPDVLILNEPNRSAVLSVHAPQSSTSVRQSFSGVLEIAEDEYQKAVMLYRRRPDETDVPITRFELLSPSNINDRLKADAYDRKREETLRASLNLVELHYLDTMPPVTGLRPYVSVYPVSAAARVANATPYYVAITRPQGRETAGSGMLKIPLSVDVYPFGVDVRMPVIDVPLSAADGTLTLDLQAIYDQHFFEQRWGGGVYYDEEVPGSESFSKVDQDRLFARLLAIKNAQVDLLENTQPLSVADQTLRNQSSALENSGGAA